MKRESSSLSIEQRCFDGVCTAAKRTSCSSVFGVWVYSLFMSCYNKRRRLHAKPNHFLSRTQYEMTKPISLVGHLALLVVLFAAIFDNVKVNGKSSIPIRLHNWLHSILKCNFKLRCEYYHRVKNWPRNPISTNRKNVRERFIQRQKCQRTDTEH